VEEKYKILLNTKFLLNQKRWSTRTLEIKENLSKKKKKKKIDKSKEFCSKESMATVHSNDNMHGGFLVYSN